MEKDLLQEDANMTLAKVLKKIHKKWYTTMSAEDKYPWFQAAQIKTKIGFQAN